MVLLVRKLFVSSHPLKLKDVLCICVLLLYEGQAEYHFAMFFYMLETNIWLLMHYYSWYFVCVTFHVITWLLSSIVKIMSLMPMFRVLWSQHSMLYIILIKIVLVHVISKIIVLLSLTYSRTSRSKLGDAWYVSNVSIIFDATCLFIHHLLCVLIILRGIFMHFLWVTY
jgi:hypothetical protein